MWNVCLVVMAAQAIVVEMSKNKRLSSNIGGGNDCSSVKGDRNMAREISGCLPTLKQKWRLNLKRLTLSFGISERHLLALNTRGQARNSCIFKGARS